MKISIVQDIAVSPNAAKEDAAAVCAYPFSCRAPGGRIVCVYRQGTDKHSRDGVLMAQGSDDGGVSWGTPGLVYDGLSAAAPESVLVGLIGLDQNGELLAVFKVVAAEKPEVYIFSEEGRKIRSRFLVARSADNGETWAKPRELLLVNTPRDTYPGANPLRFPDGRILLPLEATGVHGEEFVIGAFYDAQANILAPAFEIAHDPTGLLSFGDP
ncbi:MAG: exo-alpha-sialidase, partial [Lentisphaerae bacterium]|nr:exo-alpha-sialidase [Lentisphaerota bacterium]